MATISRPQLRLLAQAAETLTELHDAALSMRTPTPPQRIEIIPGVAALVLTGRQGLRPGFYVLETPLTTPE